MRLLRGSGQILSLFLAAVAAATAGAATVDIPSLELYSRGTVDSDTVNVQTEGEVDIAIRGGVKFGGEIALGFVSQSLEQDVAERLHLGDASGIGLTFRSASVVIRDLFSTPLAFTYFVGEGDALGSGAGFPDVFGTPSIASDYSGFLYFPDSVRYDGIHTVNGTGIKLALKPEGRGYYAALYAYQDGYFYEEISPGVIAFDPGRYSFDLHTLAEFGAVRLEAFAGATVPASTMGNYRGGLLFHAADTAGEFLASIGVPLWDPAHDSASLDLFFILFEARIYLGPVSLVPTVFLHPGFYLQSPTAEAGLLDFNLSLRAGDRTGSLVRGALESNIAFKKEDLQQLEVKLAPSVSFATAGALWQLKVNFLVFPSIEVEAFIGVKAEF